MGNYSGACDLSSAWPLSMIRVITSTVYKAQAIRYAIDITRIDYSSQGPFPQLTDPFLEAIVGAETCCQCLDDEAAAIAERILTALLFRSDGGSGLLRLVADAIRRAEQEI